MNPAKLISKYLLHGPYATGKYLIPSYPKRTPSSFLLYLEEEKNNNKQQLDSMNPQQQDIVKLLSIQYMDKDKRIEFREKYNLIAIYREQEKRDYEQTYFRNKYNKFQTWEQAFRMMKLSEKILTCSLKNQGLNKLQVREVFRQQQVMVKEELKSATEEEKMIARQIAHLASLHYHQITCYCQQFLVPKIFNIQQGKLLSQNYLKTHFRYNQISKTFKEYLKERIDPIQLAQYEFELETLAKKLKDEPENLELPIVYQISYPQKSLEQTKRKRSNKSKKGDEFLNLLSEYVNKE